MIILGHQRDEISKRLTNTSTAKLRRELTAEGNATDLNAGLSTVPSQAALYNLRFNNRLKDDLDGDPLIEVVKRSVGPNNDYIRQLHLLPDFKLLLLKSSQASVFANWYDSKDFRRANLDGTGSIVAKLQDGNPLLHHVLLFPIYVGDNKRSTPFNLSELVTSSQTMQTITDFLKFTIQLVKSDTGREFCPMFHEIVSDKSFANIGAILKAFNNQSLTEYLEVCWAILTAHTKPAKRKAKEQLESLVAVRLCSSHTCKTMNDLVHRHFKDKEMVFTICTMIGPLFNFGELEDALSYAECLLYSLTAPKRGCEFGKIAETSRKLLTTAQSNFAVDDGENLFQEEHDDDDISLPEYDMSLQNYKQHQAIYRTSKCFQRLDEYLENCRYDRSGEENKFFSPAFARAFLKNHLSYLILWGNMMSYQRCKTTPRANNGSIENYFRQKKDIFREDKLETGSFGVVRIGRYIRHYTKIIDVKVKEINFSIPNRRVVGSQHSSKSSQHSSKSSQRSQSSQDLTENGIRETQERYGKRSSRNLKQSKSSKFFDSKETQTRRSSSLPPSISEP